MVANVETSAAARRARALLAAILAAGLAGCGSDALEDRPAAHVAAATTQTAEAPTACSTAVLGTLSSVVQRVYSEGIESERTASARHMIEGSRQLRAAVEAGDAAAALAAAKALLATGHLTNLTVLSGGRTLVRVGGAALAPLRGTLANAAGRPIASYVTSVWADNGFLSEAGGISQGLVALRRGTRSVGGSRSLGSGALTDTGSLTRAGIPYEYTSFPATAYPSGAVRAYVLVPTSSIAPLCGVTPQDTMVNTLERVAKLIYAGEIGRSAHKQMRRVQANATLLEAVARREPEATRLAIGALLHQHIVRIRVSSHGKLLSDVGGPYVLGPIGAPLRLHGRAIGTVLLSIQDDEGYLRLTRRLAGLDVLMYMDVVPGHPQLVKNSLSKRHNPALSSVPASGPFTYEGHSFRVFTLRVHAFPSGPLVIRVLVPIPYPTNG